MSHLGGRPGKLIVMLAAAALRRTITKSPRSTVYGWLTRALFTREMKTGAEHQVFSLPSPLRHLYFEAGLFYPSLFLRL
jgi:hypothetical protein